MQRWIITIVLWCAGCPGGLAPDVPPSPPEYDVGTSGSSVPPKEDDAEEDAFVPTAGVETEEELPPEEPSAEVVDTSDTSPPETEEAIPSDTSSSTDDTDEDTDDDTEESPPDTSAADEGDTSPAIEVTDDATMMDDDVTEDMSEPSEPLAITSVACSNFIGGSDVRCEIRGTGFGLLPGEEPTWFYYGHESLRIWVDRLSITSAYASEDDPDVIIVEGCWICGRGDESLDVYYFPADAVWVSQLDDCRDTGPYGQHAACLEAVGTLLSVCTERVCGNVPENACGFECSEDCGSCAPGCTCTEDGACDCSAVPEACDGADNNGNGVVDEGLTRPCATACGDGVERCEDGRWVDCDALPELPEACDGTDNDCDGTPDDGCVCVVGTFTECGTTTGECDTGIRWCSPMGWDAACEGAIERAAETCNGLDDDCDGSTDEGCLCDVGATEACGNDIGVCAAGTRTCTATGWSVCSGGIGASDEVCDGVDNDCNGSTDEGFSIGQSCNPPSGACTLGSFECDRSDATHLTTVCSTGPGGSRDMSTAEVCDDLDNDCDGETDEDFPDLDASCSVGLGVCERYGEKVCRSNGSATKCNVSAGTPWRSYEYLCNGLDDDCDGSTDEGLTRTCSTACGNDVETCSTGVWIDCTAPPVPVEVCDGGDNDCDGLRDEICPCIVGSFRPCGTATGECQQGEQECVATDVGSSEWMDCIGATDSASEICNGRDDDCDGIVDDGFGVGQSCNPPGSVCMSGWFECNQSDATRLTTICNTGPGGSYDMSSAERCDSNDNDCDGATDEDFVLGEACVVGVGTCTRSGTTQCSADGWATRCSVNPGTPQAETCDGLDNNCDGVVDDGLGDACCLPTNTRSCGSDTGECVAGTQTCGSDRRWGACSGIGPVAERCDVRDNDCDGSTDEDFPTVGSVCIGWCTDGVTVCSVTGSTRCTGDDPDARGGCPSHPTCGNGIAEGSEECDGDDLAGQTCGDLGPTLADGALSCTVNCTYDTSDCPFASDAIRPDDGGGDEEPLLGMCSDTSMCGVSLPNGAALTVPLQVWVATDVVGTPVVSAAEIGDLAWLLQVEFGTKAGITFDLGIIRTLPAQFLDVCSGPPSDCPISTTGDHDMFAFAYTTGSLNVYIVRNAYRNANVRVGGWSHVPGFDGVGPVVAWSSQWSFLQHAFLQEILHTFGLGHTFEDALCDTPVDPGTCEVFHPATQPCCLPMRHPDGTCDLSCAFGVCTVVCVPGGSLGYAPLSNPMDYYACGRFDFTDEQVAQGRCVLEQYLTHLDTDSTPPCTPEPEICDTVDQDCDGNIAEGTCDLRDVATTVCVDGICGIVACVTGYANCNGDPRDGCEATVPCGGCPECQTSNGYVCVPASDRTSCTSDGNACTTDACASGVCQHDSIVCASPPLPTCITTTTLRVYGSGSCTGGSCSYDAYDTTCANGCMGGVCVSDPCAGVICNDGSSCTTDSCVGGSCVYTSIANDCGSRTCGSSLSGCFTCGSCSAGQACSGGACVSTCACDMSVCDYCYCETANEQNCPSDWYGTGDGCDCACQWTDPDCCVGECTNGETNWQGCDDPSPYVSYCAFEQERTCAACSWGSWSSCEPDTSFDQYGVDIGTWCGDVVCITLTSCGGGTCRGYISTRSGGPFTSTDAIYQILGDDGTVLMMPSECGSYEGRTRIDFSFSTSKLNLTGSSTYRGVRVKFWGGGNCYTTTLVYTSDTTWVERCY